MVFCFASLLICCDFCTLACVAQAKPRPLTCSPLPCPPTSATLYAPILAPVLADFTLDLICLLLVWRPLPSSTRQIKNNGSQTRERPPLSTPSPLPLNQPRPVRPSTLGYACQCRAYFVLLQYLYTAHFGASATPSRAQ